MSELVQSIQKELKIFSRSEKIALSQRFFKTGPGEYGEGDVFLSISMPHQRQVAKQYFSQVGFPEIEELLLSPIHEHRMVALLMLTYQFPKADSLRQRKIYDFYLAHTDRINNWDLVDVTAPRIIGQYLLEHSAKRKIFNQLVISKSLWERRISIVSTYTFIKAGELGVTFLLAEKLLNDKEDIIHKATGWMLREAGKIDQAQLEKFLDKYARVMPRTMLRYSLEKFPEKKRQLYLTLSE